MKQHDLYHGLWVSHWFWQWTIGPVAIHVSIDPTVWGVGIAVYHDALHLQMVLPLIRIGLAKTLYEERMRP